MVVFPLDVKNNIPLGGPDGGDGGHGGDVVLIADPNMTTLLDFTYQRKYSAERGQDGGGSKCYGKQGKPLENKSSYGYYNKRC